MSGSNHCIRLKKENAHDDPIYCAVWTRTNVTEDVKGPCMDFILTGGLDCLVKVWKYQSNKLELFHTLSGHSMAVVSLAVSPDGHTIASSSLESTLVIWDLLTGNKVHEIKTNATDVWKMVFSPNGAQVATGSHTGKVIVYGIKNGSVDKSLDTRGKFLTAVAWSPDDKYIASGASDGAVCTFDVAQGKLLHTIESHTKIVRSVNFSPNSQLLVTASDDGMVHLYNVATARLVRSLEHKSWAVCAVFSPDSSRVASACADGSVRVALKDDFTVLATFKEHCDTVWSVQFNSTGTQLVSAAKDKCINIYECPIPPKNHAKKPILIK